MSEPVRWILPYLQVTGAESPDIDGVYEVTGQWLHRAPVWSKTSADGETIVIYRDRQGDGLTFWYIERRHDDWQESAEATSLSTWDCCKPSVFYCLAECSNLNFEEATNAGFRVAPPKYNFGEKNDPWWRACEGGVEPGPKIEQILWAK